MLAIYGTLLLLSGTMLPTSILLSCSILLLYSILSSFLQTSEQSLEEIFDYSKETLFEDLLVLFDLYYKWPHKHKLITLTKKLDYFLCLLLYYSLSPFL